MRELNVLFAVLSVTIEYKKPARFNDSLLISVEPHTLKPASISFKQNIRLQDNETNFLTSSEVNVVCLNAIDFTPCAIPKTLHQTIQSGDINNAN